MQMAEAGWLISSGKTIETVKENNKNTKYISIIRKQKQPNERYIVPATAEQILTYYSECRVLKQ